MNAPGPIHPSDPLARLEARVRWLTAMCAFLTLGLLAVMAWQFAPRPKRLEANAFVLRDAQWRRVGEFGLREDGSPMFRLNNVDGRERVMISVRESGKTVLRLTVQHDFYPSRPELGGQATPPL